MKRNSVSRYSYARFGWSSPHHLNRSTSYRGGIRF